MPRINRFKLNLDRELAEALGAVRPQPLSLVFPTPAPKKSIEAVDPVWKAAVQWRSDWAPHLDDEALGQVARIASRNASIRSKAARPGIYGPSVATFNSAYLEYLRIKGGESV